MHKYEQLVFGAQMQGGNVVRAVLGASPGMGLEVRDEIVRYCEGWGQVPPLGMEHPALMSFRMTATMPVLAGRLYAIIRVGKGLEPIFHAVVISDQSYTSFLRNPYTLARAISWMDEWSTGTRLDRGEVKADPSLPVVNPPSGEGDMGLVDEALLKLLIEGRLALPLERPSPESDRCLSLIISCMPETDRKDMRFASFATHEGNNYTLAATFTENCHFAGWQRMLSAWIAGEYVDEIEQYVTAIREYLPKGDLAGVTRVSMRMPARPGTGENPPGGKAPDNVAAHLLVEREPRPMVRVPQPANKTPQRKPAPGVNPVPRPRTAAPSAAGPAGAKPTAIAPAGHRTGPGLSGPRRPTPMAAAAESMSVTAHRRSRTGSKSAPRPRVRRSRKPLLRVGAVALVLAAGVFTGLNWLDGKTLTESLEWARLPGWMADQIRSERAPTLLEVVDVGMVYDRQMRLVNGQSGLGFKPSEDRGRNQAMANLRHEAAVPLTEQVKLFDKLATDGIQQGSRPDREIQRMGSLADQGDVLMNEISRLELAYYSFAAAAYWEDLPELSDAKVAARRDSLLADDPAAIDIACADLWTRNPRPILTEAARSVDGMSTLMHLFESARWSAAWEKELAAAAEKVSPTASTMTRAYRNSAFAFVRIKKAERESANRNLPFTGNFANGKWPSPAVAAGLPALRAQVRNFEDGHVPQLLQGVLDLYVQLKSPTSLAAKARHTGGVLNGIEANAAYRFHPDAYRSFVDRIRYQATVGLLGGSHDIALVPGYLCAPETAIEMATFRDALDNNRDPAVWRDLAATSGNRFLADWAGYQADRTGARLARSQKAFDTAWSEVQKSADKLREMASKGEDWSRTWRDTDRKTRDLLGRFEKELANDPERLAHMNAANELATALARPLTVSVGSVTVRLDHAQLTEATDVRVEMKILPGNDSFVSGSLSVGPAAPEGTGWVGNVNVDWKTVLGPEQRLVVNVVANDGAREILVTECPSLNADGGVGLLTRPLAGDGGTVGLKLDKSYWAGLAIPALDVVF